MDWRYLCPAEDFDNGPAESPVIGYVLLDFDAGMVYSGLGRSLLWLDPAKLDAVVLREAEANELISLLEKKSALWEYPDVRTGGGRTRDIPVTRWKIAAVARDLSLYRFDSEVTPVGFVEVYDAFLELAAP